MRVYTLFYLFTATANAAASLQIVTSGTIKQVQWAVAGNLNADAENYIVELGLVPTLQSGTNDSQGGISSVTSYAGLLTSGAVSDANNFSVPLAVPVKSGDKLYLHASLTGTAAVRAICYVTVA